MLAVDAKTTELLRELLGPEREIGRPSRMPLSDMCWEEISDAARLHGLVPQMYAWVTAQGSTVPLETQEHFRREFERNAFQCMANAAELLEVLRAFQDVGIPAMPFKGVVLGATAYSDMMARTAGDLDLLIRYRDLLEATRILKARGYQLKTKTLEDGSPEAENYFEYHFERPNDGSILELRWRLELTQPRYRHDLGFEWVWPRRRMARLAGGTVPNLDPETALLILCMHGTKHVWSRLMWINDVAKLLESEPCLDWDFTLKEAKRVGLIRSLALGVLLAQRLAAAPVPPGVIRRFEHDRTARRLARTLEKQVLEQPGRVPDGRVPYNLQILDFRDRAAVIFSPAILQPSARDRAVVKLPKILSPVYYLIRPFRMLLDRTGR